MAPDATIRHRARATLPSRCARTRTARHRDAAGTAGRWRPRCGEFDAAESPAAVVGQLGAQPRPLAVELLPHDRDAAAADREVRMRGALAAHRALAVDPSLGEPAVEHPPFAVPLVEPHRMATAVRRHRERGAVMRTGVDAPALEGRAHRPARPAVRRELRQRMVALVGREHLLPHHQRRAVDVVGDRDPAAFAGMVGELRFRAVKPWNLRSKCMGGISVTGCSKGTIGGGLILATAADCHP
jgi:hypothetical protein